MTAPSPNPVAAPIEVARIAPAAIGLDYANPRTSTAAPVAHFLFAAILFGATHWTADCLIGLSTQSTPYRGRWPSRSPLGSDVFWTEQLYELGLTFVSALIVFGVQWLAWRVKPVPPARRVGVIALIAGLAYCAAGWLMYHLSDRRPFNSDAAQACAKALLAALVGLCIAGWRAGGRTEPAKTSIAD